MGKGIKPLALTVVVYIHVFVNGWCFFVDTVNDVYILVIVASGAESRSANDA